MPEGWLDPDPFAGEQDPEAAERERRRREREERRRAEGRAVEPDPLAGRESLAERLAGDRGEIRPAESKGSGGPPRREPPAGRRNGHPRRPGGGHSPIVRRAVAFGLLLATLAATWFAVSLFQPFHGEGSGSVNVEVPEGAGVSDVAGILESNGVISNATLFEIRVTLAGKRSEMYPGTYTLAEDMSYGDAIEALSTIPVERTVTITIPEGLSRAEIAEVVAAAGLDGDYMRASRSSPRFDPARYGGRNARSLEGFLFPATYELPAGAGAAALVNHQVEAFRDRLAGIDLRYARSKNLNLYDVVTIASMVEREVSVPEERRLVASVIYNRLGDGIPLGIDATIRYAVDNFESPLTESELATDSPYNTRLNPGLPPGPIGNPGEESLRAAARPAGTDYLYYVVEPGTCGEHSFSATEAEFQRDVAEYNRAREEAGGQSPTECP